MIKRIICAVSAVLMLTASVFAASDSIEITAPKDFYGYKSGKNAEDTAKVLGDRKSVV